MRPIHYPVTSLKYLRAAGVRYIMSERRTP